MNRSIKQLRLKETLGVKKQGRNQYLWCNDETQSLVKQKKQVNKIGLQLSAKRDSNKEKYLKIQRETRKVITTVKREIGVKMLGNKYIHWRQKMYEIL